MTASRGAVKRCQKRRICFLTENPGENGVNGALESKERKKRERENRICSRSGGRIKVAAQGRRKNPIGNLGPVPGRNKIFRGSGVLTRAVESRR